MDNPAKTVRRLKIASIALTLIGESAIAISVGHVVISDHVKALILVNGKREFARAETPTS